MHLMPIYHSEEKKTGVNHNIVKIGRQLLKFQKILNVQIRIRSPPILILCGNKITLIMHN